VGGSGSGERSGTVELMEKFKHKCELKILQCSPNPLRREKVNVAFVLRDTESSDVEVVFSETFDRLLCLEPNFDIEFLRTVVPQIRSLLANVVDIENHIDKLPDQWPFAFEVLPGSALLTNSLPEELALLKAQYLPKKVRPVIEGSTRDSGRDVIFRHAADVFGQYGVWDLLKKEIPMADYVPGDWLKIDMGYEYPAQQELRLIHCLPMRGNGQNVKSFAFSYAKLRQRLPQQTGLEARMWALVEDDLSRGENPKIDYLWNVLEQDHGVVVATNPQAIAAEARVALGL
jgi:hypothetical protein